MVIIEQTHIHTHIHTHTHTYIHTYTYIHTHIHTALLLLFPQTKVHTNTRTHYSITLSNFTGESMRVIFKPYSNRIRIFKCSTAILVQNIHRNLLKRTTRRHFGSLWVCIFIFTHDKLILILIIHYFIYHILIPKVCPCCLLICFSSRHVKITERQFSINDMTHILLYYYYPTIFYIYS